MREAPHHNEIDPIQLDKAGGHYVYWLNRLTADDLHSKADIAAVLAWYRAALAEADEPPRREPLADWAIETIAACCVKGEKSVEWALRAVERAHGIGGDE